MCWFVSFLFNHLIDKCLHIWAFLKLFPATWLSEFPSSESKNTDKLSFWIYNVVLRQFKFPVFLVTHAVHSPFPLIFLIIPLLYTFLFLLVLLEPLVFHSYLLPYSCLFFLCLPFLTFSQVLARCTGPGQKERITPQQCSPLLFIFLLFLILCSLPFFMYFSLSLGWKIRRRKNWKWLQMDKSL